MVLACAQQKLSYSPISRATIQDYVLGKFRKLALAVVAGRSVGIPPLTLERLEDLPSVRVEIEGTATKWAAHLILPANMDHLESLMEEMYLAGADNDHFAKINRQGGVAAQRRFGRVPFRIRQIVRATPVTILVTLPCCLSSHRPPPCQRTTRNRLSRSNRV